MGREAADFDRLYAEHAEPLLSFLVLRTGNRALAEDVLADTFERVLRKRGTFDRRRGSEKGWLYTIALNLLRDHLRRQETERNALHRVDMSLAKTRPTNGRATSRIGTCSREL